mmetsp:Transcript_22381/g.72056  ORF Transcript_22381/g.72056 Transcript_22381/m.72056 type:complete len:210 (-) Transcript_22381:273-902(-)
MQVDEELRDARGEEAADVVHRELAAAIDDLDPGEVLLGRAELLIHLLVVPYPRLEVGDGDGRVDTLVVVIPNLGVQDGLLHEPLVAADRLDEDHLCARVLQLLHEPGATALRRVGRVEDGQRTKVAALMKLLVEPLLLRRRLSDPPLQVGERLLARLRPRLHRRLVAAVEEVGHRSGSRDLPPVISHVEHLGRRAVKERDIVCEPARYV